MKLFFSVFLFCVFVIKANAGTLKCSGRGESISLDLTFTIDDPLKGHATDLKGTLSFRNDLLNKPDNILVNAPIKLSDLAFIGLSQQKDESGEPVGAIFSFELNWSQIMTPQMKLIYNISLEAPLDESMSSDKLKGRTRLLKYINSAGPTDAPENMYLVPTTRCKFTH